MAAGALEETRGSSIGCSRHEFTHALIRTLAPPRASRPWLNEGARHRARNRPTWSGLKKQAAALPPGLPLRALQSGFGRFSPAGAGRSWHMRPAPSRHAACSMKRAAFAVANLFCADISAQGVDFEAAFLHRIQRPFAEIPGDILTEGAENFRFQRADFRIRGRIAGGPNGASTLMETIARQTRFSRAVAPAPGSCWDRAPNDAAVVREHHSHGESYHLPAAPDNRLPSRRTTRRSRPPIVRIAAGPIALPIVPFGAGTSLEGHVQCDPRRRPSRSISAR